jgi:hypothetical protein
VIAGLDLQRGSVRLDLHLDGQHAGGGSVFRSGEAWYSQSQSGDSERFTGPVFGGSRFVVRRQSQREIATRRGADWRGRVAGND